MKYFLDSVRKEDMEKWFPLVDGVTSNPIHLAQNNLTIEQFLKNVTETPGGLDKKVFVQVSDRTQVEKTIEYWNKNMIRLSTDGMRYAEVSPWKDNLIFKVTMHPEFYPLIKSLVKTNEYKVAATTIYDAVQINQAMEFGCDYTMVYKHKNENQNLFAHAARLKQVSNSDIKLVGASFRNKVEVIDAMLSGMNYSTLRADTLEQTFQNTQLVKDFSGLYA